VNFNTVKMNTHNNTVRNQNHGGVSFCGDDYFRQGAVLSQDEADKFVKEFGFTTEAELLKTK